jgi:hypothetical protein
MQGTLQRLQSLQRVRDIIYLSTRVQSRRVRPLRHVKLVSPRQTAIYVMYPTAHDI